MPENSFELVVVGGGFAGVATAYHLTRMRSRRVVLVERDPAPGQRASGLNAGMIRTLVRDPEIQSLALSSAKSIAEPPEDLRTAKFFRRTGSVILASGEDVAPLREAADRSRAAGREVIETEDAPGSVGGWLEGARFDACFLTPDDGVVDIHALLQAYLHAAIERGLTLRTGREVTEITTEDGRVTGVLAGDQRLRAPVVVNAAGAWAGALGRAGAGEGMGLNSRRRHLFSTGPVPGVDPRAPFTWHDSAGFYFRPESGGLLLSGCDETPLPAGDPPVDPAADELLAAKLVEVAPALADLPVKTRWAGLRTFTADCRPAIGWDPILTGLYWVAGLGGHGVTASSASGALAARDLVFGPARSPPSPFSLTRF